MFCPLLPAIILPTSFILFYIKKVIASHITTTAAVNSCTLCLHTVQPADQPRTRQARDIPLCQDKLPLPSPYAAHPICRPRSHWLHHCQVNLNSPLSTLTCWYSHSVCSSAHTSGYIPAPPVDHSGRTRCSGEGPPAIPLSVLAGKSSTCTLSSMNLLMMWRTVRLGSFLITWDPQDLWSQLLCCCCKSMVCCPPLLWYYSDHLLLQADSVRSVRDPSIQETAVQPH